VGRTVAARCARRADNAANLQATKIVSSTMSGGFPAVRFAITLSVAHTVLAVPAFAQSDKLIASNLAITGVVREYVRAEPSPASSITLPQNLRVPPMYQPYVDSMLRWSPTFRRQCLRLAQAPWLTVVLAPLPVGRSDMIRARTHFETDADGRRTATMAIGSLDDQVELIAHELEHVIEQLDGVDLRARATLPETGVHSLKDAGFETVRAARAGRAASEEVRRHAD
jgi:hypothetical protein